ncbi:MAG: CT583 family protein [Chlamydiia bacterium]
MDDVNTILKERLKKNESLSKKMDSLAERSNKGQLSSFAGVFKVIPLQDQEVDQLKELLETYKGNIQTTSQDLEELLSITSEVKAINSQAIILHGERIQKAQQLLKSYKDGAFSTWLIYAYGNRQTPYNFLQYYEFYKTVSQSLKERLNDLPKQAIYTLATRQGPLELKEDLIRSYQGESKELFLEKIRNAFPLSLEDKRRSTVADQIAISLERLLLKASEKPLKLSQIEKRRLTGLLSDLNKILQ